MLKLFSAYFLSALFDNAALAKNCTTDLPKTFGIVTVSSLASVHDGDSFAVTIDQWPSIDREAIGVRVAGIDAPERWDKCTVAKELAVKALKLNRETLANTKVLEPLNIRRNK